MATKKPRTVLYRRKREKKTNYSKRLKLILSGKERVVLRFTNQKIIVQLVKFEAKGDKILLGADSFALKKWGWSYSCKNLPAAYLTGLMFGKEALKKGHDNEVVLDTGFKNPLHKSKAYALLKGLLDSGLQVPSGDEKIFPTEGRLKGNHIKEHAIKIKDNKEDYNLKFAQYLKSNMEPEKIVDQFELVKNKINA